MTAFTAATLERENQHYAGTLGVSTENRSLGFQPAFRHCSSGRIYRARFADGRPAPFHCLEGLPDEVVVTRTTSGRVSAVSPQIESGFVRDDRFYSRAQAAQC